MKLMIFLLLLLGFGLLFWAVRLPQRSAEYLKKARGDMEAAARQRNLEGRHRLLLLKQEDGLWASLEREMNYCGLKVRFPGLTAEGLIAVSLAGAAVSALVCSGLLGLGAAVPGAGGFLAVEFAVLRYFRTASLRAVNDHLMKLLDFLGNYSITSGEVTIVFHQVSRYMEEPIRSVLDGCYYEAQTTGDVSLALLSMAEKIEHPKFKELARNMEISKRYCADFTALVSGSRRSLREYLRVSQARKGMLREAFVNMSLLLGLSFVVLAAVGSLVQMPAAVLLTGTLPGKIGLGVLAVIGLLFLGQVSRIHR